MNSEHKNTITNWIRKNSLLVIMILISLGSMLIGAGGYALLSNLEKGTSVSPTEPPAVILSAKPQPTVTPSEPEETRAYWDVPLDEQLQDYIRELCDKYSIQEELILAIIETESSFRPNLVSGTDDYGYMQINKVNHEWLREAFGITDFLDPYQNILCGVHIIAGHLDKTDGDITKALMRYNNGATGASRLWEKGIISTKYTDKVTSAYERYQEKSHPDRVAFSVTT